MKRRLEGRKAMQYPYNIAEYLSNGVVEFTGQGILRFLNDCLTERERSVIEMRWRDGMTLAEVGEAFGITGSRARQIEVRALRKLNSEKKLIEYGSVPYAKWLEEKEARWVSETRLNWFLQHGTYTVTLPGNGQDECKGPESDADQIRIEDMDLTVRSYNCLKRAGMKTLGDVTRKSAEELLRLRNMGKRSLEEVIAKVEIRGYHLREDADA